MRGPRVHRPVIGALLALATATATATATPQTTAEPAGHASPAVPVQRDAGARAAHLFDTWTGYQTGQYLEGVATGDFDGDGAPDVAWARQGSSGNQMVVQLNRGDGTLGAPLGYAAASQSNDIAAGDLDGDADLDLVVASQGDTLTNTTIDLYLNDGSGVFTHRTTLGGSGPKKLALADLNGDQRPDIALANFWGSSDDISVLLNKGNGTFGAEKRYPIGDEPSGITAADLDGDGDRDLAVSRVESGQVKVHLLVNSGRGSFTAAKVLTVTGYAGSPVVVAADWDGDDDQDLAVSGLSAGQVWTLSNTGGLTFSQASFPAGFTAFDLRAADIDSDGDQDLLDTDFSSNAGEFVVLRNDGSGAFAAPVSIESGRYPHDLDVADFDGDGRLDIAVANRDTDTGAIHLQRSDGTFSASSSVPPIYPTANAPFSLVGSDVDLDGDIDVIATLPAFFGDGDAVQVMLNDGRGRFTTGDSIPSLDFPQGIAAADFNGDRYPDLVWTPDDPPYPYVVALNNGDGTYGKPVLRQTATCGTGDASTADVDNDGDTDIIVPNNRSGCGAVDTTARIVLNKGDGTFQTDYGVDFHLNQEFVLGADLTGDGLTDLMSATPQNGIARGTGGGAFGPAILTDVRGTDLVASDLDTDGDLDVISGDSSFSRTTVMRNNGRGMFTHNTVYPSEQVAGYSDAWDVAFGDFDADGRVDIAVSNTSANDVGLHFGHGDGTFEPRQIRYGTHANPLDVVVADFDGDGRSDIVTAAAIGSSFGSSSGVSILLNRARGRPACTVTGTAGPDVLTGTSGHDVICGLGGDDQINARGGNDWVVAGGGSDLVKAGADQDVVYGEGGADTLNLRDGVDGDIAVGGSGADRCRVDPGDVHAGCR